MIKMNPFELLPFFIYLVLVIFIGFKSRRKRAGQDEYLLSGRSLSIPAFVATLVTTWYGGILGVGEFVHSYGLSVWFVFGLPYYIFAFMFAVFLAPKIRRAENVSIPDMLYRSYSRPVGLLGSIFLLFMTSPAPYILMLAVLLQEILGWSFPASVVFGTVVSVVYVYHGGFRSVVQTDKLQFLFMFAGFVILFFYLISGSIPLNQLASHLDAAHKSPTGGMNIQQLLVWFLIASWTFIDPGFHQRCAAAASAKVARKGILFSIAFWFVFDMLTMITGLYAFVLLPDINPLLAYPELANLILPPFLRGLFYTGLLAIIMSTIDSYTFLSALTFGRDIVTQFIENVKESTVNNWVKAGLVLTAVLSIVLVMLIPSVIELWYNLGSLFIPPLLLPLSAAYFPHWKISPKLTFWVMSLSFSVTLGFFFWGELHKIDGYASYPLGLEPFFPGLIVSLFCYGLANGRIFSRNSTRSAGH